MVRVPHGRTPEPSLGLLISFRLRRWQQQARATKEVAEKTGRGYLYLAPSGRRNDALEEPPGRCGPHYATRRGVDASLHAGACAPGAIRMRRSKSRQPLARLGFHLDIPTSAQRDARPRAISNKQGTSGNPHSSKLEAGPPTKLAAQSNDN
jgi:hypothetical protein